MSRSFRSVVSIFLCGMLVASPMAVSAQTVEPVYTEIATKSDLDSIRQNPAGRYRLTADIAFSAADFAIGGAFYNDGDGWQPIGDTYTNRFTGELDGNGHTISGLSITLDSAAESVYAGLFGYAGGTIRHLRMADTTIVVTGSQYVYAGTIVAAGMGTIQFCSVDNSRITLLETAVTGKVGGIAGRMFSGRITACDAEGSISAEGVSPSAGGIVGQSHATMESVYSHVNITLQSRGDSYAGGITGINEETLRFALSDGTIDTMSQADGNTGGIVGWNQKIVADSLAVGLQTRKVSHYDNYGGVCGVNDGTITASYYAMDSCPSSPAVSGVTGLSHNQIITVDSFTDWDFENNWCIGLFTEVDYPIPQAVACNLLRWNIHAALNFSLEGERYTAASLNKLRLAVTQARSITDESNVAACYQALESLITAQNGLVEKTFSCAVQNGGQIQITGENRYGEQITLSAIADAGNQFSGLVVYGRFYPDDTVDVTVSGNENATAYFRTNDACTVVFRGKYGRVLDVQTVTSSAQLEPPEAEVLTGYTFTGWNTDLTQLDLSAGCVSVDAVYAIDEQATGYTLTLIDAVTELSIDEPLGFDTRVKLSPAPKDGKIFSHWLVNGAVASSDAAYTLYVAGNDTVQAVYKDTSSPLQPTVSLQSQSTLTKASDGRYTLSVIGQVYVPDDITVIEYGVLFAADSRCVSDADSFVLGNLEYATQTVTASSVRPNRRYLIHLRNIPVASTRYARAYMVVKLADDRQITLYSPTTTVVIPE